PFETTVEPTYTDAGYVFDPLDVALVPAAPPPAVAPQPAAPPVQAAAPPPPPAAAPLPAAPPAPQTGDTYVLAIGVSLFEDAAITPPRFAEQDARSVYGFYATDTRSPTRDDRCRLLLGREATRIGIMRAIREHLKQRATRPEDTVVLYIA